MCLRTERRIAAKAAAAAPAAPKADAQAPAKKKKGKGGGGGKGGPGAAAAAAAAAAPSLAPAKVKIDEREVAINMLQGVGDRARVNDFQCAKDNLVRAARLLARLRIALALKAGLVRVGGKAAFVPTAQRIVEKLVNAKSDNDSDNDDDEEKEREAEEGGDEKDLELVGLPEEDKNEDEKKEEEEDIETKSTKKRKQQQQQEAKVDKKAAAAAARREKQIAALLGAEKSVSEELSGRVKALAGDASLALPLEVKQIETPVLQRVVFGLCMDIAAARAAIDAAGGAGKKKKKKKKRTKKARGQRASDEDEDADAAPTPPTADYKPSPSPHATVRSQYFDAESLKVILQLSSTASAREVWKATFEDFDGLTHRLCRSARDRQRLVSISVHGSSTTLIMESSKRMVWARAAADGTLPAKIEGLIADYEKVQYIDCGRRDWLQRCLHEHVRRLYKAGSYGQDMVEALARRGDAERLALGNAMHEGNNKIIDSVYLLRNVRCGTAKNYSPSVSDDHLGLGQAVFARVHKQPLSPSDWRGGCVLPERAVALGLMSLRTGADLRRFLESVLVAGDTGVETLCMAIIGQMRPIDSNDPEITAILSRARDEHEFKPKEVEAVLDKCELVFVIKRIHQVHRKRKDADQQTAEAQKAAEVLGASATATGGMRALDYDAMCKHMQVYVKTRPAIYKDSLRRALGGARHYANIGRQHRARAEVQQLADAVALFRAYLASLENDMGRREELMKRALMPATKHDDRVVFFVGQPRAGQQTHAGHRSGDSMQFVAAAAKQMATIGLNEYYTSQKCKACGSQLVRTRGWSVRFWRCPHSELNGKGVRIDDEAEAGNGNFKREGGRPDGKWRHVAEENKDVIAAMAMLRIGVCVLIDGGRPVEWCSHDVRDAYEKRIEEEEKTTAAANRNNADTQPQKKPRTTPGAPLPPPQQIDEDEDGDDNDKAVPGSNHNDNGDAGVDGNNDNGHDAADDDDEIIVTSTPWTWGRSNVFETVIVDDDDADNFANFDNSNTSNTSNTSNMNSSNNKKRRTSSRRTTASSARRQDADGRDVPKMGDGSEPGPPNAEM